MKTFEIELSAPDAVELLRLLKTGTSFPDVVESLEDALDGHDQVAVGGCACNNADSSVAGAEKHAAFFGFKLSRH